MKKLLIAVALISAFVSNAQWTQGTGQSGLTAWSIGHKGTDIWAGTQNGTYKSTDGGLSFTASKTGIPNSTAVWEIITLGNKLIAGTLAGVFISTDDGANWVLSNTGLTSTGIISMVENAGVLYAGAGYGGVFVSTDGGSSWTASNTGLTNNNIRCLVANSGTVYAGTDAGIFSTTNNGSTWTAGAALSDVNAMAINGGTIYTGNNNNKNLSYSTDGGATFSTGTNSLSCNQVFDLEAAGNVVFGAGDQGLFITANGVSNCVYSNAGLANLNVRSSMILGNYIYVGVVNGGVHRRLLSDFGITASLKENEFAGSFSLYPNPSKGKITISTSGLSVSTVTLTVKDVLSKEVFSGGVSPGETTVDLGNNLLPGIYFVQLSDGKNKMTRKLVIE